MSSFFLVMDLLLFDSMWHQVYLLLSFLNLNCLPSGNFDLLACESYCQLYLTRKERISVLKFSMPILLSLDICHQGRVRTHPYLLINRSSENWNVWPAHICCVWAQTLCVPVSLHFKRKNIKDFKMT